MFKWKKLGRVFDPSKVKDRTWFCEFAQSPSVIVFDKFVRVYFCARPKPDVKGQYVSHIGFVELNRNDLFEIRNISNQPVLTLGALGTFDEFGTYPASVTRSGTEIRMYYAGHTRCESVPFNTAIGIGISKDDGLTFNRLGPGPVLSYSPDEPFSISGPKIKRFNDHWYLWYITGKKWFVANDRKELVYKIRMAVSEDGISWKKLNKDIISSRLGENEVQASPDVFFLDNKYHMFFCYMVTPDFRTDKKRTYRIGYAYSTDLIHWTRDDQQAGIDVSSEGWDSEMVAYPHVFELDDKYYMLYLGNEVGRFGFGLAILEKPEAI